MKCKTCYHMAFLWLNIRTVIEDLLPAAGQPSPRIVAEKWEKLQKLNKKIDRMADFAVWFAMVSSTSTLIVSDLMHNEFHEVLDRCGQVLLDVAIDVAKASRIIGNDLIADIIIKHYNALVGGTDEKTDSSDWKE